MSLDQRLRNGMHSSASAISPDYPTALRRVRGKARRRSRLAVAGRLVAVAAAIVVIGIGGVVVQRLDLADDGVGPATEPVVTGTYVVDVPDSAEAREANLVGRWEVTLRADGTVRLTPPSTAFEEARDGLYRVDGDLLNSNLFLDVPGCQVSETQVGIYRWTRIRDELTFTEVDDGCAARRELFSHPWKETP
jgi:hypothetical protein